MMRDVSAAGRWAHGPVAETVFHEYRDHGWQAIPAPDTVPAIASDDADHIDEITEVYGEFTAKHLEHMTHAEQPWLAARGNLPAEARSSKAIAKEDMRRFYRDRYDKVSGGDEQEA